MLNTLESFADEDEPIYSVYSSFTHSFDDYMYSTLSFYFCPIAIFSLQKLVLSVFRGYWPFLRSGGTHVQDDFTGYFVCKVVTVSRVGGEYLCKGIPFL